MSNKGFVIRDIERYLRISEVSRDQKVINMLKKLALDKPTKYSQLGTLVVKVKEIPTQFPKCSSSEDNSLAPKVSSRGLTGNESSTSVIGGLKLLINRDIVECLPTESFTLLGKEKKTTGSEPVICAFMPLMDGLDEPKMEECLRKFEENEREFVGIGRMVTGDTVDVRELGIIAKYAQSEGVMVLIDNNKQKFILRLTEKCKRLAGELNNQQKKMSFGADCEYFTVSSGQAFSALEDDSKNVSTKKIHQALEKETTTNVVQESDNTKKLLNFKFAKKLDRIAGLPPGKVRNWGYALFPTGDRIYKYKFIQSFGDLPEVIKRFNDPTMILVEKGGVPSKEYLKLIWEYKLESAGAAGLMLNIIFFKVVSDPSNEEITFKGIENNNYTSVKRTGFYSCKNETMEDDTLVAEEIK